MCTPSPPPPPDYKGAAIAQGDANKESAIASNLLNNPNVINPYGTQTFTGGENGLRPTMTQTFSPEQQALYDQSVRTKGLLGGLGAQGATALQGIVGRNLDLSGAPARGSTDFTSGAPSFGSADFTSGAPAPAADYEGTRNKVIQAMMGRADEDYAKQTDQTNSDLIARGIRPGTNAYADARQMIERSRNDARSQAEVSGGNAAAQAYAQDAARRASYIGERQATSAAQNAQRQQFVGERNLTANAQNEMRRQAIAETLAQRQTPLNEINALMSGSQVNNPFAMPGTAQNTNVTPPPLYGAATAAGQYGTDVYNAQAAGNAGTMNGLFSLGAAAMPFILSDRRLKSNIVRIGTHPLGIGIYEYDIFGERDIGVMAQELLDVKPSAVYLHPSGYLMVNYGAI